LITASIKDRPIGAGLIISIGLHIALVALVMFGLPIFWQKEPLPEVIGIQLAQMSDITAAPKAQKVAPQVKKGADAPKPVDQKQPPKPDTPPPPVEKQASVAPPPAPIPPQPETKPAEPPKPEDAEVIPDKTKKPEEKKPEEKKPEPPKPEQKKVDKKPDEKPKKDTSDQSLDSLLKNVLKDQPAPDTKAEKTKKATQPQPLDASEAPQASQFSEIPLTASETDGLANQVRQYWNIGSLAGAPDLDKLVVTMHITLQPDGTITGVTYDNDQPGNPYFRQAAESAKRAFLMMQKVQLPPGKSFPKITYVFRPGDMN